MNSVLERIWKFLISLRVAVVLLVSLAVSLMAATFIESAHDTKTAQYFIYQSSWFYGLLSALGVNILAVAISRYPWKWRHIPFLMAHAGILMMLGGAWLTYIKGLDGNLRITEGESSSAIELDQHLVSITDGSAVKSIPLPWRPPVIAKDFKPIELEGYGVVIDRYLSNAESKVSFVRAPDSQTEKASSTKTGDAVQFKIIGAPMGGAPEVWLWSGDSGWAMQKMGLARFMIRHEDKKDLDGLQGDPNQPEARFDFVVTKNGKLKYETVSIRGEKSSGVIDLQSSEPQIINPGWKMPIKVQFKKFVPNALNQTDYVPVAERAGTSGALPMPAIHLKVLGGGGESSSNTLWLGLGDRAELSKPDGTKVSIGYFPKMVILPFALHLKTFEVVHDPGTNNPAAYVSHVQTVEQLQKDEAAMAALPVHSISMNEPLKVQKYTFYQASFIPDFPRPTTTILSVNYDPGRELKYWGSLLIVLGSILLFTVKSFGKKKEVKA